MIENSNNARMSQFLQDEGLVMESTPSKAIEACEGGHDLDRDRCGLVPILRFVNDAARAESNHRPKEIATLPDGIALSWQFVLGKFIEHFSTSRMHFPIGSDE